MKAHELGRMLLKGDDEEITASIDISTGDEDAGRRIYAIECFGVNSMKANSNEIVILFCAEPEDNEGKAL